MKHTARIVVFSAFACISAQAAPFMAVGDNAELFVTASAAVQLDDNIYLDTNNAKSDTIFSFTPGADFVFGKGSATTGNLFYREEIRRYADNSNQNTQLANVGVNSSYTDGMTKADFNASYAELAQNDNQVRATGDLIHRKLTNAEGKSEFGVSEKTKFSLGAAYAKTDYAPVGMADSDIWTFPVDVYYEASPKLDWSLGYQYRRTQLSFGRDSNDNFFNLGARGEFSPKLSGQVRVGYTERAFKTGSNANLLGVSSGLTYVYSDKTSYQLNLSNDFGSAVTGDSTKNFTMGVSSFTHFTEQWALNLGVNYRSIQYPDRKDGYTEGLIGIAYIYNSTVNFSASYTYRNNSSDNLPSAEFTDNVFSLGANIRY